MTHLASFGPVFFIAALRCLFRTSNTLVAPKTVVSDNKKLKEIEKKLTNGLNDADTSFQKRKNLQKINSFAPKLENANCSKLLRAFPVVIGPIDNS